MPAERYFVSESLEPGAELVLRDKESHHLVRVMRTKEGERVELVDGKGTLAIAELTKIGKREAYLSVLERTIEEPDSYPVILAQAIPRANRLDTILEKGTELGVTEIWLFPGERSERRSFSANQTERMQQVCIAALKQCGRLYLPEIKILPSLGKWEPMKLPLYFGDVEPSAPLFSEAWERGGGSVFAVGPESGFSDREIAKLRELGGKGVKLHENILRTDTAPIVALSLIKHWLLAHL